MGERQVYIQAVAVGCLLCVLALPRCMQETVRTPAERLEAAGGSAAELLVQSRQATSEGQYPEALALADSLIAMAPDLPAAYYQRGQILMRLYQLEEADEAFEQTTELDPYHWGGWHQRGHVAFEQGSYYEALRRYHRQREVIESSPENIQAYYRPMHEAALPQVWVQIGRTYELLQKPDSAQMIYEKVLALDSTHAQANIWLADLYENEGRIEEALIHARRAWRQEQKNPEIAYQLGRLLLKNEQPAAALPLLEYASSVQPWEPGVHYNLGRTLIALGRTEEGQQYLDATDEMQDLDQAIDQARAAAAQYPNDPARWREVARLLGRAGREGEQQQALAVARALTEGAATNTPAATEQ